jgi:hydrogenase expression/formation protein HypD
MKFVSEFRQGNLAQGLLSKIHGASTRSVRFMEFCGGHTVTIFRYGIRQALPKTITMLSGPGCPICVTSNADLDKAIALARIRRRDQGSGEPDEPTSDTGRRG